MPPASESTVSSDESRHTLHSHSGLPPDAATSAAHELNNIFTAILLNLSATELDRDISDETRKHIECAESEIAWGQAVTQMLLALSVHGALKESPVPVASLAESIRNISGGNTTINPSIPSRRVSVDKTLIGHAFRFLALRLARTAGIGTTETSFQEIRADTGNPLSHAPGTYVRVSLEFVQGDIPGVLSEERYTPFRENGEAAIDLALAASDAILRRHGGVLAIRKIGSEFAGFSVYLPVLEEDMDSSAHIGGGKILLMDDEESIRDIAHILFGRHGYRITTVADGAEAVRRYRAATESGESYDVVIMDLTVPLGMGGREAIRLIRDMDPEVRAIVSSGYATDPAMTDYRAYGFSAAVEKPYRIETLLCTVEALLHTPRAVPAG